VCYTAYRISLEIAYVFQMSMWEIGLILVIALIVLGPRQLAEAGRAVGKMYRELTKMVDDLRSSVDLDSITSAPRHDEPRPEDPSKTDNQEMHRAADPEGHSGPDFYAELLEQSREEEGSEAEKSQTAGKEAEQEPDKEPGDQESTRERKGSPA